MTDAADGFPITQQEFAAVAGRARDLGYAALRKLFEMQLQDFPDRPEAQEEGAAVISGVLGAVIRFAMECEDPDDVALRDNLISQIDFMMPQERSRRTLIDAGAPQAEGNA